MDLNEVSIRVIMLIGFTFFLLIWVWKALNWVWLRPKKLERYLRQQGFSGNSYRFLIGDKKESNKMDQEAQSKTLDLSDDIVPRMMPFIHHTIQKYGKNCFTWLGPFPNIIMMDPELIREILSKHYEIQKPRTASQADTLLLSGVLRYEGDKWSKHRSLLVPSYRIDKLKTIMPTFQLACDEMVKEFEALTAAKGSAEVDMWEYCQEVARNMLVRAAFGSSHEDGKRIFALQRQQVLLALEALRTVYIPGLRFLPTKYNRERKQTERLMKSMFEGIIEKKEAALNKSWNIEDDLITTLLVTNSKLIQEQGKASGLTVDEIIGECKAFYLAGENGSSVLLVWTMVMLSQHQDWQERAREEVFQVFGRNKPDVDELSRLKIVNMILLEVLRMYPAVFYIMRATHEETKLRKLSLPPGVIITIPMLLVHRDPDLWGDDVNEFKPERFAQGVAGATKGQLSYLPFSYGPKTCMGQNFSMLETKLTVSMILQRFRLELSPSYTHAPYPWITIVPQHGAHLILHKL